MDRPLAPPTFLHPYASHPLDPSSAYTSLSAFIAHQSAIAAQGIPTTQRTQLARLVDALGVETGLLSADASRARVRERERTRRAEERAERRRRRGIRREARKDRARLDGEAAQREKDEWEAQVEGEDEAVSEDEVPARPEGAEGSYEQVGEDEQEGAGLRDTARDEDEESGSGSGNASVDDDQEDAE